MRFGAETGHIFIHTLLAEWPSVLLLICRKKL
jgi:hypothetical protein